MLKKIKKLLVSVAAALMLFAPAMAPAAVYAAEGDNAVTGGLECGVELDPTSISNPNCAVNADEPGEKLNGIIKLVINIFSLIVGIIAVFMVIIGGLKYIMSGGESGQVGSAKNTILFAVVGLVIVALAQFIVRFVLTKVTQNT